jgi:predicted O-methyltransferase YrrM
MNGPYFRKSVVFNQLSHKKQTALVFLASFSADRAMAMETSAAAKRSRVTALCYTIRNRMENKSTMSQEAFLEFLSSHKGMVSVEEGLALNRYAAGCAGGDIVEIGSFRGKSSVALAEGALRSTVRVFCIDPHTEFTGVYGGKFGPKDHSTK